jgi:hypothetical protein
MAVDWDCPFGAEEGPDIDAAAREIWGTDSRVDDDGPAEGSGWWMSSEDWRKKPAASPLPRLSFSNSLALPCVEAVSASDGAWENRLWRDRSLALLSVETETSDDRKAGRGAAMSASGTLLRRPGWQDGGLLSREIETERRKIL